MREERKKRGGERGGGGGGRRKGRGASSVLLVQQRTKAGTGMGGGPWWFLDVMISYRVTKGLEMPILLSSCFLQIEAFHLKPRPLLRQGSKQDLPSSISF